MDNSHFGVRDMGNNHILFCERFHLKIVNLLLGVAKNQILGNLQAARKADDDREPTVRSAQLTHAACWSHLC